MNSEQNNRQFVIPILFLTLFITALVIITQSAFASVSEDSTSFNGGHEVDLSTIGSQPNCRYGVTPLGSDQGAWVGTLNAGWYLTFQSAPFSTVTNGSEFAHMIRVKGDGGSNYTFSPPLTTAGLGNLVTNNPDRLWIIGNEPDVTTQDNVHPTAYARAYHEAYTFIKDIDPNARVANAGLSMATPARLAYLDIVWDTYYSLYGKIMPVDVWVFHLYILAEIRPWDNGDADGKIAIGTNPALAIKAPFSANDCSLPDVYCRAEHDSMAIFKEQVVAMRTWMKEHGQQDKALLLTEYSLLYPFVDYDDEDNPTQCFLQDELGNCFTPNRVNTFMEASFNYLETAVDANLGYPRDGNRLVQQWMWFSVVTGLEETGGSSNLLVQNYDNFSPGASGALTRVGENFQQRVPTNTFVNLAVDHAQGGFAFTDSGSGTAESQVSVTFYNNGTTHADQSFSIGLYDESFNVLYDSVTFTPTVYGCASQEHTVTFDVDGLAPGVHQFGLLVDNGATIFEQGSEDDNSMLTTVIVDPEAQLYLPVVSNFPP